MMENQTKNGRVVVVDDDSEMRSLLKDYFTSRRYVVSTFPLATEALKYLATSANETDLVISDINMPQLGGLDFVTEIKKLNPDIPVVLITAFGSIDTAIGAIRRGAYDYMVKPFKLTELQVTADRAIEYRTLRKDNQALRQSVKKSWGLGNIIGKSPAMQNVFELVRRVSGATANVLVMGESGTGKEVIARAIHETGPRAGKPFVAINCTAIPENLLESELFGHAKGAFTGADRRKTGLFEEANGGTLFLDEIGDMPVSLQAKLLRVIQERKIRPVGDTQPVDIDVRIIAATHKDLKTAIKEGRFREDLYYRLAVIPIQVPPLRHRKEDIPILAEHFLNKYAAMNNSRVRSFTEAATHYLMHHRWEGNVRELENSIERAVVLCTGDRIDVRDFPSIENATSEEFYGSATQDFPTIEELERRYILFILEKTGGQKSKAAQILGVNRRTLYRKQKEYGFDLTEEAEDLDHRENEDPTEP